MALQTLPPDSSTTDILGAIEADGACIVRDLLKRDELDAIVAETAPWIEASAPGDDGFTGYKTKRTGALISRCPTTRPVVLQSDVLAAARAFLDPYCAKIQLHLTQTIAIMPGQGSQFLHRDRLAWGGYIPQPIEPQFNTIWALTDFTRENGATQVVPGSQKWESDRVPDPSEVVQAEMSAGSVLLYTGSVIHSGGENRSGHTRIGMNITYCLSWLRQEENQYLSCPPEVARELDPELADLVGYTMGNYALGYYSSHEMIEGLTDMLPPEAALGRLPANPPKAADVDPNAAAGG